MLVHWLNQIFHCNAGDEASRFLTISLVNTSKFGLLQFVIAPKQRIHAITNLENNTTEVEKNVISDGNEFECMSFWKC